MKKIAILALSTSLLLTSCGLESLTNDYDRTAAGAGIGAVGGAIGGYLIAKAGGGSGRQGALIGAGVGALTGAGIGLYQDNQERELRQELRNTGAQITRHGNKIIINLPSNITFATGQSGIKGQFYPALNAIAKTLSKYNQTLLDVNGHTDSVGSFTFNQSLSERRALSVARYVGSRGIDSRRFLIRGFGESQPIASNGSASGRAANRRVEISIVPLKG